MIRCLVTALTIIAAGACASSSQSGERRTSGNPATIVLPNAQDVRTTEYYDGQLGYKLPEPYPAEPSINEIRKQLTALGWRPRDRDLLNPSLSYAITARWARL